MVEVKICVGSSCHLKGSEELVGAFQNKLQKSGLDDCVILSGSFCLGRCNRSGVTVSVNDKVYEGVTVGGFDEFFKFAVLPEIEKERGE